MNSDTIKQFARDHGADLIGIASIDRFRGLPKQENPLSIFPECQSVIVLGSRILRGALRGIEEGTNFFSTYGFFGYQALEDSFLSQTTYDCTCFIETQAFEAVPLFGYDKEGMAKGVPVGEGKPAPNVGVDVHYAAHVAGLGEVGLGGFFLTPRFGPRQRFALILTDAPLEADAVIRNSFCEGCDQCVQACPFGGIQIGKKVSIGVEPYRMETAEIDYNVCRSCPNGAMTIPGRGDKPDRLGAACARACVVKLESEGRCENTFQQPFRKRKPWVLDLFSRPLAGDIGGSRNTK
jgi:ferredoxin